MKNITIASLYILRKSEFINSSLQVFSAVCKVCRTRGQPLRISCEMLHTYLPSADSVVMDDCFSLQVLRLREPAKCSETALIAIFLYLYIYNIAAPLLPQSYVGLPFRVGLGTGLEHIGVTSLTFFHSQTTHNRASVRC